MSSGRRGSGSGAALPTHRPCVLLRGSRGQAEARSLHCPLRDRVILIDAVATDTHATEQVGSATFIDRSASREGGDPQMLPIFEHFRGAVEKSRVGIGVADPGQRCDPIICTNAVCVFLTG